MSVDPRGRTSMPDALPPEVRAIFAEFSARRKRETRPCAVCGAAMENVTGKRRYCSNACRQKEKYRRHQQNEGSGADTAGSTSQLS